MIKVEVKGKIRVVRDKMISYQTENDLECTYKGHDINIAAQDTGGFYCTVIDSTGGYLVDGYFNDYSRPKCETIEDCLAECINNII